MFTESFTQYGGISPMVQGISMTLISIVVLGLVLYFTHQYVTKQSLANQWATYMVYIVYSVAVLVSAGLVYLVGSFFYLI